jgi:Sulfotransferase domain
MARTFNKVFVIGLSKTGTTTLSRALDILGISSLHYPSRLSDIADYQSASDLPVALAFKKLDKLYPGSLFILTTRDQDPWLESMEKHIAKIPIPNPGTRAYSLREAAFGSAGFDRDTAILGYQQHIEDVEKYFEQRKDELLVMNLPEQFNWHRLCEFLGYAIPTVPFPVENVASSDSLKVAAARIRKD